MCQLHVLMATTLIDVHACMLACVRTYMDGCIHTYIIFFQGCVKLFSRQSQLLPSAFSSAYDIVNNMNPDQMAHKGTV